ncbi:MAG: hypothetical protein KHZ29_08625 [Desulfovibrionaceae bacterium]|nr:hypothetical protein [Desulfovibrionaceae bacterium]
MTAAPLLKLDNFKSKMLYCRKPQHRKQKRVLFFARAAMTVRAFFKIAASDTGLFTASLENNVRPIPPAV